MKMPSSATTVEASSPRLVLIAAKRTKRMRGSVRTAENRYKKALVPLSSERLFQARFRLNLFLNRILILDGVDLVGNRFLITEVIVSDRFKIFVKLIDERDTSRNVEAGDILIGDIV